MQLSSEPGGVEGGESGVQAKADAAHVPFIGLRSMTVLAGGLKPSGLVRALVALEQGDRQPLAGL